MLGIENNIIETNIGPTKDSFMGSTMWLTGITFGAWVAFILGSHWESGMKPYGVMGAPYVEALEEESKNWVPDNEIEFDTRIVQEIASQMRGPNENLEFLARKLYYEKRPDKMNVLLGTPIYVCYVPPF